jgi:hypothetical protein
MDTWTLHAYSDVEAIWVKSTSIGRAVSDNTADWKNDDNFALQQSLISDIQVMPIDQQACRLSPVVWP